MKKQNHLPKFSQGPEGGEKGKLLSNGCRASIWKDEKSWRWMLVMVAQQWECN